MHPYGTLSSKTSNNSIQKGVYVKERKKEGNKQTNKLSCLQNSTFSPRNFTEKWKMTSTIQRKHLQVCIKQKIICCRCKDLLPFSDQNNICTLIFFWETNGLSTFHDMLLQHYYKYKDLIIVRVVPQISYSPTSQCEPSTSALGDNMHEVALKQFFFQLSSVSN